MGGYKEDMADLAVNSSDVLRFRQTPMKGSADFEAPLCLGVGVWGDLGSRVKPRAGRALLCRFVLRQVDCYREVRVPRPSYDRETNEAHATRRKRQVGSRTVASQLLSLLLLKRLVECGVLQGGDATAQE